MKNLFIAVVTIAIVIAGGCGENKNQTAEKNTEESSQPTKAAAENTDEKQQVDKAVVAEPKGISLDELKKLKFFGTEPGWTLTFKDDHMIYTEGYEGEDIKMLYYGDLDGSGQRMKKVSDNELQVRLVPEMAKDKAYIWTATVKREECSDGMSDNSYPYSIHIDVEDGSKKGCGRKM